MVEPRAVGDDKLVAVEGEAAARIVEQRVSERLIRILVLANENADRGAVLAILGDGVVRQLKSGGRLVVRWGRRLVLVDHIENLDGEGLDGGCAADVGGADLDRMRRIRLVVENGSIG